MDSKIVTTDSIEAGDLSRPCRRPHVQERTAGKDLVLYDPVGGRLHVLNATAAVVWRLCDGSRPTAALAGRFREEYAVGADQNPLADIRQVLQQFLEAGLIEEVTGLAPSA